MGYFKYQHVMQSACDLCPSNLTSNGNTISNSGRGEVSWRLVPLFLGVEIEGWVSPHPWLMRRSCGEVDFGSDVLRSCG